MLLNIPLPKRFDRDAIDQFILELDFFEQYKKPICLDFSSLNYAKPTAILVAGSLLRRWVKSRMSKGYECHARGISSNVAAHSYLMHLGFFDYINLPIGKKIGEARGSANYLPITRISKPQVDAQRDGLEKWYEAIEGESRRLAVVLAKSSDDDQKLRTYRYAIREIIRNVFEHSSAAECYVCGQSWWNGRVEIAVLDEGEGIPSTLGTTLGTRSHKEVLAAAVGAGISRTVGFEKSENIYDNSGFGLFVLRHLGASFGWFVIGSGQAKLLANKDNLEVTDFKFDGTFIGLNFDTVPKDFRGVLEDIIFEGENEASSFGNERKASARSKISE